MKNKPTNTADTEHRPQQQLTQTDIQQPKPNSTSFLQNFTQMQQQTTRPAKKNSKGKTPGNNARRKLNTTEHNLCCLSQEPSRVAGWLDSASCKAVDSTQPNLTEHSRANTASRTHKLKQQEL